MGLNLTEEGVDILLHFVLENHDLGGLDVEEDIGIDVTKDLVQLCGSVKTVVVLVILLQLETSLRGR